MILPSFSDLQAVLHADVVPGERAAPGGVDAVDVAQVVVVRPADRRDIGLRLVELLRWAPGRYSGFIASGVRPRHPGTHSVLADRRAVAERLS